MEYDNKDIHPANDKSAGDEVTVDAVEKGDVVEARPGLKRQLKRRHIAFLGYGGGIGVGLFLGAGVALAKAGPVGLFLAYAITGSLMWGVVQCLAEMATLLPVAGTFPHFVERFLDPAAGFAMGWNFFWGYSISIAAEISAAAVIIGYWSDLHPAIWVTVCLFPMIIINFLPVKFYGESEVITASIKVLTFVGLIIAGIVIDLGGGPTKDRLGFRYWKHPGPFNHYPGVTGSWGEFLAFFSAFIKAAFTYNGSELVVIAAGEASNPTKQIPRAARRVIYRIMLFYIAGILIIGMTVPFDDVNLMGAKGTAANSPFVLMLTRAGISGLPHLINACILTSAWSAGNTYTFVASRALYSLSIAGKAPRIFQRTTKNGVPYLCVAVSSTLGLLSYLSAGGGGATQAFNWISNLLGLTGLLTWGLLALTFTRFHAACKAQGIDRKSLPWAAPLMPYVAYYVCAFAWFIALFSGFGVFIKGNWKTADFFANYTSLAVYVCPFIGYKIYKKTKFVKPEEADLFTGRLNPEDEVEEPVPTTWWGKFVDWLL